MVALAVKGNQGVVRLVPGFSLVFTGFQVSGNLKPGNLVIYYVMFIF
jgi:hypothetical protein